MSFTAPDPTYCRLTVLAPRARVDVALPADLPVAELVPMVLELVGEPAPDARPEPWRLFRATGTALPPGADLRRIGVLDGELLRIAPDRAAPPPPVFDDPVHALAAGAEHPGPDDRLRSTAVLLLTTAAAVVLLVDGPSPGTAALLHLLARPAEPTAAHALSVLVAALAAAALTAWAAWLVRRRSPGRTVPNLRAATTAALAGVPLATVAGWAALPGAPVAVRLLLAVAAAGAAAAIAQLVLRTPVPALVGVTVAAVPVGAATLAVARLAVPPTTAAITAGSTALLAGPLLPRAALWMSGVPRPVVPADAGELLDVDHGPDLPAAAELAARADLARGYLAGLVGGCALVAGTAAVPAAMALGWSGPALAAVTVALLGLWSRSYRDLRPSRALVAGALLGGIGLVLALAWSGPPWARPAAAVVLLAAATAVLRAGRRQASSSPVRRRTVDLGEGLLTAAVIPLAFGATDLYGLVRAW